MGKQVSHNNGTGLKNKVMSGLFWTFGERIIAQSVSFIVSILLARILMPEEYGVIAIVLVFINIANVFVSNGFGESLVRKKDSNETDFSTIFYCSFVFSGILYAILFVSAPVIADFYKQEALVSLLRVLALKLPISSISTIQHAYVSKHMIFKKFFFSTLGGTLISGILGILMAYGGCGAWALVAQYLCNTIIDTVVLFITVPWRPQRLFSRKSATQLIGYGWKLTASSLINEFYSELRSLIIGRVYSSADLAYYNRGNQFPSLIITNVDTAIGKVAFPAMTKVAEEKQRIKQISRRAMKTTSYIIFPLMIGLMAVSEPLVRLLLTDKWLVCVPFLQCSCIYYMCQPIQTTNWQIIKAVGRSDLCLKLEILKKTIGVSIILLTMNIGVLAIAIGNAAFAVISMFINIAPNRKLIGYTVGEQIKDIIPPLVLSILMGIAVTCIGQIDVPAIIGLVLQIAAGGAFYFIGSYLFRLDSFLYLLDIVKSFIREKVGK